MLRNRNKPEFTARLVVLALLLPLWASAQTGQGAMPEAPAGDVRARMWAATARFVYADDQALDKLRPSLLKTIDSSSVKNFSVSLQKAVALEEKADQKHLHKFQGIFSQLSTGRYQKALPADLANEIGNALLENKTSAERAARVAKPAFKRLQSTLRQLSSPAATVVAPVALETTAVVPPAAEPASQMPATAEGPPPATIKEGTPATSPWTWAALGLSVLSLLVAVFKPVGKDKNRHRTRSISEISPSVPTQSFSNEQFEELRTLVRTEVDKVVKEYRANAVAVINGPAANESASVAPLEVKHPAAPVPPPAPPQLRTLFANQQPIDGLFQRNSLAGAPASYTIFELTIDERSPNQARFSVTRNPAGHAGFIGSHHTILGGACTYQFPQGNVTRIVTDVPGLAQLTAGGDWQVSQKAQIRFE